ncbi:hypothetical protein ACH5RR_021343 [Cinchona calisaya]|uniref:Reverse transcriptase/retrotransposon-derived protein RNase H-like domain-containing protein n=1 Tax=Cinchona calisaya TaxID=153742 RepID=A0ABD2ZHZ8_9GENT
MGGEMAARYVERFKTARMRCNASIPEEEFVATALLGIRNFKFVKYFEGKMFRNLFELANRVNKFQNIQQQEAEIKAMQRKNMLYKELDHEISYEQGGRVGKDKSKAVMETQPLKSTKMLQQFLGKVNFLRCFISNLTGRTKAFSTLLRFKSTKPFVWETQHQEAFDASKAYSIKPPVVMPPDRSKSLKLYISATDDTLGCFLA